MDGVLRYLKRRLFSPRAFYNSRSGGWRHTTSSRPYNAPPRWGPQRGHTYSQPRSPPRAMDPVAAWYRFRGRVSSLDLILIGSAAAALLGGLVILDEAFSGAWRAFNTGVRDSCGHYLGGSTVGMEGWPAGTIE